MKLNRNFLNWIILLAIATGVFFAYLSVANFDEFPAMLEGKAYRPAAYRILVPRLASLAKDLIPSPVVDRIEDAPRGSIPVETFHQLSGGRYPAQALIALLLILASFVGFVVVERNFLGHLGYTAEEQLIIPVVLAGLTVPLSMFFSYVYDMPQVFLFALSLLFLYQGNWTLYLLSLTIAFINKETTFFLIIIFAFYYFRRLPLRDFLILLGAQLAIFITVRAILTNMLRALPGAPIFWTIRDHIRQYTEYPSTFLFTLAFFGIILFLMSRSWKEKPEFLRHASIVFFIVFALFFMGGMPMEFRIFLDILPVFGVLLFPHRKSKVSPEASKDTQLSTLHVQ